MNDEVKQALLGQLTVSVNIAAKALGLSRGTGYEAARTGDLPTVRVGKRILVPTAPLRKMLGIGGGAA